MGEGLQSAQDGVSYLVCVSRYLGL